MLPHHVAFAHDAALNPYLGRQDLNNLQRGDICHAATPQNLCEKRAPLGPIPRPAVVRISALSLGKPVL